MNLEILKYIGIAALSVLGLAWLFVSFTKPNRARAVVEWLAATAMYAALISLFVSLSLRAYADDFLLGIVAFGFLLAVFGIGAVISVVRLFQALAGGPGGGDSGATN